MAVFFSASGLYETGDFSKNTIYSYIFYCSHNVHIILFNPLASETLYSLSLFTLLLSHFRSLSKRDVILL